MNSTINRPPVRKPGRTLGLGCLIAGACFLFDPYIGIFDVLPDCIGYLLFALGLSRLSDMDDRLADAARGTRRLALLGVARLLALVLAFGLMSPGEQPVFMLLALFSLAVLDLIVFLPMWNSLSGGLTYLGARCDATALLDRTRRHPNPRDAKGDLHRRNLTERYTAASVRFFILKEALAVLPELTVLTSERGGVEIGEGSRLYEFVGLFRGVALIIGLVIGTIWLIQTIGFVRRILADKPCMERFYHKYTTEVLVQQDLFARRAVKASFVCLAAAAFLTVDFHMTLEAGNGLEANLNLIPDLPAAVLLFMSLMFVRRYARDCKAPLIATAAYGGLSVMTWLASWKYVTLEEVLKKDSYRGLTAEEVATRADRMLLLQTVTALVFAVAVWLTLRTLYALARRYTGVAALHDGSSYAEERTSAIHGVIRRQLIAVAVVAVLCALSTVVQWGAIPALPELASVPDPTALDHIIETIYNFVRDGYYVIDIGLGLLLGALCIRVGSEVCEQMEYRAMME